MRVVIGSIPLLMRMSVVMNESSDKEYSAANVNEYSDKKYSDVWFSDV